MRRTTLTACEFGYGEASFQPAIARAQLQKPAYTCNSGFQPDKSCRLPACIFDQAGCLLDGTGSPRRVRPVADKMPVLHLWRPVEAESVGALNSNIHKLPYEFLAFACWPSLFILRRFTSENGWRRRKYDNFICAGSAHEARAVCFAGPLAKHFHLASDQAFENPAIRFVYHLEQIMIAVFFDVLVDLIRHFRGRSIAPR